MLTVLVSIHENILIFSIWSRHWKAIDNWYMIYSSCSYSYSDYHDNVIKIETSSTLLALCEGNPPVTGEFPSQWPVTRIIDVFFNLRLNKRMSKQSRRRWFETPSRSWWRHYNGFVFECEQWLWWCGVIISTLSFDWYCFFLTMVKTTN